jgi:putative ABC transport system permease protein
MAWRNLWRNRRRSLATVASIACGLAAVAVFAGYKHATYTGLANIAIHSDLAGHLTINKAGWRTEGKLHPARYLFSEAEIAQVRTTITEVAPGARVVERMNVMGLVSNGHNSTIFIANGVSPADMRLLRGPFQGIPGVLRENSHHGVIMSSGLADILGLKAGDGASILINTVHGQANMADIDIDATVDTGNLTTNDKWMTMPLELAQDQLDATGKAEGLTVLLPAAVNAPALEGRASEQAMYTTPAPDDETMNALRATLSAALARTGLRTEMITWQEQSPFYLQVRNMFDMMFGLLLGVVLAIVVLSVANAMGMAVVERTREIGTLRAIGMRRASVVRLFVTEAVLLVAVGLLAGVALTFLVRAGVNALDVRYVPPSLSRDVQLYVGFDPLPTVIAALALAVLATLAATVPARRAAHAPIVSSLGHV